MDTHKVEEVVTNTQQEAVEQVQEVTETQLKKKSWSIIAGVAIVLALLVGFFLLQSNANPLVGHWQANSKDEEWGQFLPITMDLTVQSDNQFELQAIAKASDSPLAFYAGPAIAILDNSEINISGKLDFDKATQRIVPDLSNYSFSWKLSNVDSLYKQLITESGYDDILALLPTLDSVESITRLVDIASLSGDENVLQIKSFWTDLSPHIKFEDGNVTLSMTRQQVEALSAKYAENFGVTADSAQIVEIEKAFNDTVIFKFNKEDQTLSITSNTDDESITFKKITK